MASPDNLILSTAKGDFKKNTEIAIPPLNGNGLLFRINEFEDACLSNQSQNFDCFIEDLEQGGEKKISFGENAVLNDAYSPNPVMEYRLRIVEKKTGKSTSYFYKINQTSATNDCQYKAMVRSIASYDENLLYDKEGKFLPSERINDASTRSLFVLCRRLLLSKRFILSSLDAISLYPIMRESRGVVKTRTPGRQNFRSVIKNACSPTSGEVYSSKLVFNADIPLNRYLVYMARYAQGALADLEERALKELKSVEHRFEFIDDHSSKDPQKRSKNTLHQIDALSNKRAVFEGFLAASQAIRTRTARLLSSEPFISIVPSPLRERAITLYPNYFNFESRLFLPLSLGRSFSFGRVNAKHLSAPFKPTSFLFEAYCLLSVDSAITSMGFENVDEAIDYEHIVKRFIRDEYEFDLFYSLDAKDVSSVKEGEFYYLQKQTRHITPDFFLLLKKKDIPLCLLVMEAKCRKTRRVATQIAEGEFEASIRDYLSIRYSWNENPFFLPKTVDSLWLLFPEDTDETDYAKKNQLEYRFVKLAIDGDEAAFIESFAEFMMPYLDD